MRNRLGTAAAVVTIGLAIGFGSPAWARHGGAGGGPKFGSGSGMPPGLSGFYGSSSAPAVGDGSQTGAYPPGWSRGRKRGWSGHNMPPGLYRR